MCGAAQKRLPALPGHRATPTSSLLLQLTRQQTVPGGQQEITQGFLPLPTVFVMYTRARKPQREQAEPPWRSEGPPRLLRQKRAHGRHTGPGQLQGCLHSGAAARCALRAEPAPWALHPDRISGGAVCKRKFLQRPVTNEKEIIHMASTVILMGYLAHHCGSCLLQQRSGA